MIVILVDEYKSRTQIDNRLVTQQIHAAAQFKSIGLRFTEIGVDTQVFIVTEQAATDISDIGQGTKFGIRKNEGEPVIEQ